MQETVKVMVGDAVVWSSEMTVREPMPGERAVTKAYDIAHLFSSVAAYPQEVFAVAYLNGAHFPIETRWVTVGLVDQNQVHPREVFGPAMELRAAAIVMAHNHPSGTLTASVEDVAITNRLKKAGELLGIRVLDHVILTPDGQYLSMRQDGHF